MYTALVIEEHDILREKIAGIISREPHIDMVGQVKVLSNGFWGLFQHLNPDLVVLRIRQEHLDGEFMSSFETGKPGTQDHAFLRGTRGSVSKGR